MEYKTVEFWEIIYEQFIKDKDAVVLCSNANFREMFARGGDFVTWISTKARVFVEGIEKPVQIGSFYLFRGEHCWDKEIRIEFLQWLINDLKNEQNILHRE
jgi:hypothetical protein